MKVRCPAPLFQGAFSGGFFPPILANYPACITKTICNCQNVGIRVEMIRLGKNGGKKIRASRGVSSLLPYSALFCVCEIYTLTAADIAAASLP